MVILRNGPVLIWPINPKFDLACAALLMSERLFSPGHLPTIDIGSYNTGSTYSTVSSSCGLFYGTNSDGSRTFTEGDTIKFIVSSFGGTIATGLKVTIYNS